MAQDGDGAADLAQETARATEDIAAKVASIQHDTAAATEELSKMSHRLRSLVDQFRV